jgi:hypothetical protein
MLDKHSENAHDQERAEAMVPPLLSPWSMARAFLA